ncbi:MAG: hypothetical protein ACI35O_13140, partial [Bacillaceae bacterium]
MHLQRFVLSGLIIGVALLLPTYVFADKPNLSQKQAVTNKGETNADKIMSKQVNGNENKQKEQGKKHSVVSHSSQSKATKPAHVKKTLPEQASDSAKEASERKGKPSSQKSIPKKPMTNPGKKKGLAKKEKQPVQRNDAIKENKQIKSVVTEKPSKQIPKDSKSEEMENRQIVKMNKLETNNISKTKEKPKLSQKNKTLSSPILIGQQKDESSSGTNNDIPHKKQATPPTQSNQHSGGDSKDRKKIGKALL